MKLAACEHCGVVVDLDNIAEIKTHDEDYNLIDNRTIWRDGMWSIWTCPVCKIANPRDKI